MKTFREWMRGNGRNIVVVVVCLCALAIILDYYGETHGGWGKKSDSDSIEVLSMPAETEQESPWPTSDCLEDNQTAKTFQEIQLGFAGDICLDERSPVMRHMRKKGEGIVGCIDSRLIRQMRQNDFTVLNNEFSISDRGKPMKGKAYTFCAPEKNTAILQKLGVDAVSLANNHVFDYGETAFLDTLSSLKRAGIKYVGGGKNKTEAKKPVYLECRGKTIAIVAATRAEKIILTPEARKKSPGVFRTYQDGEYVKAIAKANKKADIVIAFVHWGTEYSTVLEKAQKQQAKDYIDAGADVVIGAHTHCMQGVGYYKGKPIFYSLGNFWFNEKTLYTTLLQLTIKEDDSIQAKLLPCLQSGKETRLLTGEKRRKQFVQYVNQISSNGRLDGSGAVYEQKQKRK